MDGRRRVQLLRGLRRLLRPPAPELAPRLFDEAVLLEARDHDLEVAGRDAAVLVRAHVQHHALGLRRRDALAEALPEPVARLRDVVVGGHLGDDLDELRLLDDAASYQAPAARGPGLHRLWRRVRGPPRRAALALAPLDLAPRGLLGLRLGLLLHERLPAEAVEEGVVLAAAHAGEHCYLRLGGCPRAGVWVGAGVVRSWTVPRLPRSHMAAPPNQGGGTGFESVASGSRLASALRLGTPLGAQKRPSTFRGDWDDRNSA